MTAVERIQAAIAKLTVLRDCAMSGPWSVALSYGYPSNPEHPASVIEGQPNEYGDRPGYDLMEGADAGLIVTLHRTIDAQLAILNDGLIVAKHWEDILDKLSGTMRTPIDHALLIADAILGADS